jgi:hypothetical protein
MNHGNERSGMIVMAVNMTQLEALILGKTRHLDGWLRRYAEDGMGGLADRSCKPVSCPHQMPAAVERGSSGCGGRTAACRTVWFRATGQLGPGRAWWSCSLA